MIKQMENNRKKQSTDQEINWLDWISKKEETMVNVNVEDAR